MIETDKDVEDGFKERGDEEERHLERVKEVKELLWEQKRRTEVFKENKRLQGNESRQVSGNYTESWELTERWIDCMAEKAWQINETESKNLDQGLGCLDNCGKGIWLVARRIRGEGESRVGREEGVYLGQKIFWAKFFRGFGGSQ